MSRRRSGRTKTEGAGLLANRRLPLVVPDDEFFRGPNVVTLDPIYADLSEVQPATIEDIRRAFSSEVARVAPGRNVKPTVRSVVGAIGRKADLRHVRVCLARNARKEVLHALGVSGRRGLRGGSKTPSKVKC